MRRARSIMLAAGLAGLSALAVDAAAAETKSAIFAGGCFWCMEEAFDAVPGVTATISGYSGGEVDNPTYEQVSAGNTGHYEVVEVEYDPAKVSYEALLHAFWRNVDPFDARGQFCDEGSQYLSAIFVADEAERKRAEAAKAEVAAELKMPVVTEILPAEVFFAAEDYHQNFHEKSAAHYKYYKWGCGRVQRLEEIWGEPAA